MASKNPLKFLNPRNLSAGFTLVELMGAAVLTTVVVGAAGFGLMAMTMNNKSANAEITTRTEINRASEFITSEIRRANNIESDAAVSLIDVDTFKSGFSATLPANAQAVLALDIPGVDEEVIYFIADAVAPWAGPKAIYRFGPNMGADGQYTNANNPSSWEVQPLIDQIDDTQLANTWTCPNSATLSPSTSATGFYACVASGGEMAQLYLNGAIEVPNHPTEVYQANSPAFARANDAPDLAGTPSAFSSSTVPFTVNNGTLTLNQEATLTFEVLGSAIQCGASNPMLPVTTQLTVNGQQIETTMTAGDSLTLPPGSANTVDVASTVTGTAASHGCNYTYTASSTNINQVYALQDGDSLPDIPPLYDQSSIEIFVENYIQDGKVKIQKNQVIYLFELGTTNKDNTAYDLQDNVVLVTIDTHNNNGHGNNADGVDSSNPGNTSFQDQDSDPTVDDESTGGGAYPSK